ncbi:MAG: FAD-dependent oxidoreductase [Halobacteriovoraceae bacterium]|nr:FAD-dependent oxidoreductase [Halobacteriovoraceae bacterium]
MKKVLIIGGGFAGCSSAHQLNLKGGYDVTLVEGAPFLGGGCRNLIYGGHPHTFGPRHFLTQNEKVFNFLDKYVPLRRCGEHIFLTYIHEDENFYNFPIHVDDIDRMPEKDKIKNELSRKTVEGIKAAKNLEEYWIASVGETLYYKMVDKYTRKMWLQETNTVFDEFKWSEKGVALKEGPRAAWDIAISAYPYGFDGYDPYFKIATEGTKVLLNTHISAFDIPNKKVRFNGEDHQYDYIINTISPDILFENCYGELPYIGREVHKIVLPIEEAFPKDVYFLYYGGDEKFTRIVEYKKFTKHKSPHTLLGIEMPSTNGRYYPLPILSEQEKAQKYFDLMPEGVFSIGRAGSYKYLVDIDDCIEQSWDVMEMIETGQRVEKAVHPVRMNSKL